MERGAVPLVGPGVLLGTEPAHAQIDDPGARQALLHLVGPGLVVVHSVAEDPRIAHRDHIGPCRPRPDVPEPVGVHLEREANVGLRPNSSGRPRGTDTRGKGRRGSWRCRLSAIWRQWMRSWASSGMRLGCSRSTSSRAPSAKTTLASASRMLRAMDLRRTRGCRAGVGSESWKVESTPLPETGQWRATAPARPRSRRGRERSLA